MNKNIYSIIGKSVGAVVIVASMALPAFASAQANISASASAVIASTTVKTNIKVSLTARFTNIVTRADQEITRRLKALNALSARVNDMQKLTVAEKGNLSSNIQSQISAMTALQTQIGADAAANNTSSLKSDAQSITASYRIFALVIPQGAIEAASDRVLTTVGIMLDLGTKLSARISTAQASGTDDVTVAQTAMADFNAKVADANTQTIAATNEVAGLKPDGGNATLMASNTATLKDARAKIVDSQKDLIAARADTQTIIKALGIKVAASASASATAQ